MAKTVKVVLGCRMQTESWTQRVKNLMQFNFTVMVLSEQEMKLL